jgi:hypothetical protein
MERMPTHQQGRNAVGEAREGGAPARVVPNQSSSLSARDGAQAGLLVADGAQAGPVAEKDEAGAGELAAAEDGTVKPLPSVQWHDTGIGKDSHDARKISVKKGAVLRYKYRLKSQSPVGGEDGLAPVIKQLLNPNQCGWHPYNRNAAKISPSRCVQLLSHLLGKFDPEEADTGAVAIQENPKTPNRFAQYTKQLTERDGRLAKPDESIAMLCAMVGHSHIMQVLRNICNAADGSEALHGIVDKSGRLNVQLVEGQDIPLAKRARAGLWVEMLSFKLEEEEGRRGVELVQMCLNDAQTEAMADHEMQVVRHAEQFVLTSEPRLLQSSSFLKLARESAKEAGFTDFAMDDSFEDVMEVIMSTCQGPWLQRMFEFHERTINPKYRRISLETFGALRHFPLHLVWLRNAFFKKAYDEVPGQENRVVCAVVTKPKIMKIVKAEYAGFLAQAESILEKYQATYQAAGLYKFVLQPYSEAQILQSVDLKVASTVMSTNSLAQAQTRLERTDSELTQMLYRVLRKEAQSMVKPVSEPAGDVSQSDVQKSAELAPGPVLIKYDEGGRALGAQPVLMAAKEEAAISHKWAETLHRVNETELQKARIFSALCLLQRLAPSMEGMVDVVAKPDMRGVFQVVAKETLVQGALLLIPLVASLQAVQRRDPKKTYKPNPDIQPLPDKPEYVLSRSLVKKKKEAFLPPFWLVKRVSERGEGNIALSSVDLSEICSVLKVSIEQLDIPANFESVVMSLRLPVFTNMEQIEKGHELQYFTEELVELKNQREEEKGQQSQRFTDSRQKGLHKKRFGD